jgi:hypothetical protein
MPIKTSQIIQDDGGLKKVIEMMEHILKLQKELYEGNKSEAAKLRAEMNKLSGAARDHQDAITDGAKKADALSKAQDRYKKSMDETAVELEKVRLLTRKQNNLNKQQAKLATAAAGSYEQLAAQYAINKARIKEMSGEELKEAERKDKLITKTKELYEQMNDLQKSTGKYVLQVGKYEEALKGLGGGVGAATGALSDFRGMLSALVKNPILGFLALIVGGLSAVFQAFKQSENGAELLARASGLVEGAFSVLTGVVNTIVGAVTEFFELTAKERWQAIGDNIKKNLTNRFEGFFDIFKNVGAAMGALIRGDFPGLRKAIGETGESVLQFTTGVDGLPEKLKNTTDAIKENADAFADLRSRQRAVIKENAQLSKALEDQVTAYELNSAAAGDVTLGFISQRKAAEAAAEANEKKAKIELQIARNNLAIINDEIRLRERQGQNVNAFLEQQTSAFQALKQAQREYTLAVRSNAQERRNIARDEFERELDFAIDFFDTQKTVNERRLKDERLSIDERQKILEETAKLTESSFKEQIKLTEDFTGQRLNIEELALIEDERIVRERLRSRDLDDVTLGRVLEILRERKLALQDIADAELFLADLKIKKEKEVRAAIEKTRETQRKAELETFDQAQALAQSEFDLLKTTEEEKTRFRIQAEIDRLQKVLELNEKFGGDLTSLQLQTFRNQIKALQGELESVGGAGTQSIYDLLGINLTDDQKAGVVSSLGFLQDASGQFAQSRINQAQRVVDAVTNRVDRAREAYQRELDADRDGLANKKETARLELQAAQQAQKRAIQEQEKAQRRQIVLDAISQSSNLLTASTKIWKQLGFPLALPAVALMWGQFIANKAQALKLTKSPRAKGSFEMLRYGDSHRSGDDIPLGLTPDGKMRTAERNEGLAVFTKRAATKYQLGSIVNSINNLSFEKMFNRLGNDQEAPLVSVTAKTDMRKTENELTKIRKKKAPFTYLSGGKTIVKNGNVTKIYET